MTATATQIALSVPTTTEDNARRDELILENMPLVTAIALQVQRSLAIHMELDDLVHAGTMGLFDAATKYRTDKDVTFRTYAKHRIRGAILDSLRQADWASRDLRRRYKQVEKVRRELAETLQRDPSDNEIAKELGLSAKKWQALMVDFRTLGLAAAQLRTQEQEDQPLAEVPGVSEDRPDRMVARTEMREKIHSAMSTLPQRYRQVISMYYDRELSMKQIGTSLGVNESRVSQIHKSALALIQSELSNRGIHSAAALCA